MYKGDKLFNIFHYVNELSGMDFFFHDQDRTLASLGNIIRDGDCGKKICQKKTLGLKPSNVKYFGITLKSHWGP